MKRTSFPRRRPADALLGQTVTASHCRRIDFATGQTAEGVENLTGTVWSEHAALRHLVLIDQDGKAYVAHQHTLTVVAAREQGVA